MNFLCFALVFTAFVAKGESSSILPSKDQIVTVLETINAVANKLETALNNRFLDRLQNETSIKEWSVNIQSKVTGKAANLLIQAFETYKEIALAGSPSKAEIKQLNCISQNEDLFLQIVDNATRQNGWCNNRLAANLTAAFQETTAASLIINAEFLGLAGSLDECTLGSTFCLYNYVSNVAALVESEISEGSAIYQALGDVKYIYTIMFGTDVPKCFKEVFAPTFNAGFATFLKNIEECTA
ncbi:unnamed protein product [Ceutorhynchus assimilis]|uniref:Uncharacterized protein n=1 Tax=Ceutorhynchus assimilis TaxID=467358 RepID=A0A9N9MGJ7_9CUCU|nr:unnamed protein product [Ceutorhynchus assimilis]